MRKRGYSYSEIENAMHIPKSTIAFWLKNTKLTGPQAEKLKNKMIAIARSNSEKRKVRTLKIIEDIKLSSAKEIRKISKKELWLMGIMLCWHERLLLNDGGQLRKGVNFTNTDPYLIKIFLKWLQEIGNVEDKEIKFDLFIKDHRHKKNIPSEDQKRVTLENIEYWSEVTGFPEINFRYVYFQRTANKKKNIHSFKGGKFGLLRVRVSSSSMLARQIAGWMKGITRELL